MASPDASPRKGNGSAGGGGTETGLPAQPTRGLHLRGAGSGRAGSGVPGRGDTAARPGARPAFGLLPAAREARRRRLAIYGHGRKRARHGAGSRRPRGERDVTSRPWRARARRPGNQTVNTGARRRRAAGRGRGGAGATREPRADGRYRPRGASRRRGAGRALSSVSGLRLPSAPELPWSRSTLLRPGRTCCWAGQPCCVLP